MNDQEIDEFLALRKIARENNNWSESDRIRDLLNQAGVTVVDTKTRQEASAGTEYTLRKLKISDNNQRYRIKQLEEELARERKHYSKTVAYNHKLALVKQDTILKLHALTDWKYLNKV